MILDAAGKPLCTSNSEPSDEGRGSTNIGFLSSKEGIDHFLHMLQQSAPHLSAAALESLRAGLAHEP